MHGQELVASLNYVLLCFLKFIIFVSFYYFVTFKSLLFSLTRSLLVPYSYVSIKSISCILFSSFELKAILLISSVKILCSWVLNLCCTFNIDLLFLQNFCNVLRLSILSSFFSKQFILLSSWVASKRFL